MSSTEPPAGSVPPEPNPSAVPPPPPPTPGAGATPPPPPPPPAGAQQYGGAQYGAPQQYGAPAPGTAPQAGVPRPGELLDRFLARLIDGVILGVVYGIIAGIVGGVLITGYRSGAELFIYYLIISVVSSVLYLGYYAYLESSRGQTIGKQIMKLKVVGPDGQSNPTMEQAVRRNIFMAFGILGIVPILGQLLGGLASLGAVILIVVGINGDTVRRQHWFDKFAGGTQVLKIG